MTNYYDILGLPLSANASEIKTAFRNLAKLYHPDKNPGGQEQFKKILLAYETLSNPGRKHSYDLRLKYHTSASNSKGNAPKTKTWTFEEKEMQRRKYYDEHIRKYEKVKRAQTQHNELKKNYNEYKYILYATPLAVLLFLLVINFATPSHNSNLKNKIQASKNTVLLPSAPYSEYFGGEIFYTQKNIKMNFKNLSGTDMIICIFTSGNFVRSLYLNNGLLATVQQLPETPMEIKCIFGNNWQEQSPLPHKKLEGGLKENVKYFKSLGAFKPQIVNEITFTTDIPEGFKEIKAEQFFNL